VTGFVLTVGLAVGLVGFLLGVCYAEARKPAGEIPLAKAQAASPWVPRALTLHSARNEDPRWSVN
jgi:hypothetical protein